MKFHYKLMILLLGLAAVFLVVHSNKKSIVSGSSVNDTENEWGTETDGKDIVPDTGLLQDEVSGKEMEPYVFSVRSLEEVRLYGVKAEDFYITNAGNSENIYYIDFEKRLYRHNDSNDQTVQQEREEGDYFHLTAENVIHVDCCRHKNYTVFLTQAGELFGIEGYDAPELMMENVRYALCGGTNILILLKDNSVIAWHLEGAAGEDDFEIVSESMEFPGDVVMIAGKTDSYAVLLADGTVWTWGNNEYDKCGVSGQDMVTEPVCVAQDVRAVWTGKLQFNIGCMDLDKWKHYHYNRGYIDNLIIMKTDGSLWACGKNITGPENDEEQDGIPYTHVFVPCEIIQEPYIMYNGLNTYQPVLEEYERIWNSETNPEEILGMVPNTLKLYVGMEGYELYYGLKDLTGDGTEELIIGLLYKGEYSVRTIYTYDEGVITGAFWNMERIKNLYSDGIVEEVWGAGGRDYYTYYKMVKNSGLYKFQTEVSEVWMLEMKSEEIQYYQSVEGNPEKEVEITEEQFRSVISQYETIPVELEWKPLEGFWTKNKR